MVTEKSRETRIRRAVTRRGYQLVKTRRRDPNAWDYGTYMITDPRTSAVVAGTGSLGRPHWSLDDVQEWLDRTGKEAAR